MLRSLVGSEMCIRDRYLTLSLNLLASAQTTTTPDEILIKQLLAEDLGTRTFPFSTVVKAASGKDIIPFNPSKKSHLTIRQIIQTEIAKTIKTLNLPTSPTKKLRRINEASRYFEDSLLESINAHPDFTCSIPKNTKEKEQRSGYPDLLIIHLPTKTHAYLDPKLYEQTSKKSSLRTFYFEPRTRTLKIQHTALHLLIGIAHDGKDGCLLYTSPSPRDS